MSSLEDVDLQNNGRSNNEVSSLKPVELMPNNAQGATANAPNMNVAYNTQAPTEINSSNGFQPGAHYSGVSVKTEQAESTTTPPFLNDSTNLNSSWTLVSTDAAPLFNDRMDFGVEMRPPSSLAGLDDGSLHQKLFGALQRMEGFQERINSLETKFQNFSTYVPTIDTSLLEDVSQRPEPEPLLKGWHKEISQELRDHLILKLKNTIFPVSSGTLIGDRILKGLDKYAKKVEKGAYEIANSKAEYYHLLSDQFHKINKELDDRRRKRKLTKGTLSPHSTSSLR